jgi:hypothetical protein
VKWATRRGVHVDRAGCAWLIRRFIDPDAEFVFVDDPDEVPPDATPFDMRGASLSHHDGGCTFETFLHGYKLADPALVDVGRIVHDADLRDERYDAPEAAGLDVLIRGLSMTLEDDALLAVSDRIFEGLYAFKQRALILGREPA